MRVDQPRVGREDLMRLALPAGEGREEEERTEEERKGREGREEKKGGEGRKERGGEGRREEERRVRCEVCEGTCTALCL